MKKFGYVNIILVLLLIGLLVPYADIMPVSANTATYYVDSASGNDNNTGTTASAAWKTLNKVNGTTFLPGDKILFKRGGSWSGQLWPKGSGTSTGKITVDAYGTGALPVINGGGIDSAIKLNNQSYWTLQNLEVTNRGTAPSGTYRRGINITADGGGTYYGIAVKNCYIHDVNSYNENNGSDAYASGGIVVRCFGITPTTFDGITIENNTLIRTDRTGIFIRNQNWRKRGSDAIYSESGPWVGIKNVVIRNNALTDIGGDGIVTCECISPLVEYNVCNTAHNRVNNYACVAMWPINCDDAVFQYNEAFNTKTTYDGQAWDCDGLCNRTIYQYNYSHDNEGGFMLVCNWDDPNAFNNNPIIRYNISQNDYNRIVYWYGRNNTDVWLYNNTFYIPSGRTMNFIEGHCTAQANTGWFKNNIIYNLGTLNYLPGDYIQLSWDYNNFYGNHSASEPADPHKICNDPLLVNPGSGGIGIASVEGYKLQDVSPLIDIGAPIPGNGGKDYWGNAVPRLGTATDIGAQEYPSEPAYKNSVQFSGNQGFKLWYYKQWDGSKYSDMTYDSTNGRWVGAQPYSMIGTDWQHPDDNDSVRAWRAPKAGSIKVTGVAKKTNTGGGDGVIVSILRGTTTVWGPQTLQYDNAVGISHDFSVSVNAGDWIYFKVNKSGNNWYDNTGWDPVIKYK